MQPLLVPHVGEMMQKLVAYGVVFICVGRIIIGIDCGIGMMLGWLALHQDHDVMHKLATFFFLPRFPPKMARNECLRSKVPACFWKLPLVR